MPTTSIASADSRQMMNSALPMCVPGSLLRDDLALRLGMELVEESVLAGLQRVDDDGRLGTGCQDLLELEGLALELDRRGALVAHLDLDALARRNLERGRLELAVLHDDAHGDDVLRLRSRHRERERNSGECRL